jgi:DNA-binding CsgD family transcriptional regulator
MMRLSSGAQALIDEVARIATLAGSGAYRAQALLEPIQRITPCDSVLITVFDAERRRQVPLLRHGFGGMRQYIHTEAALADLERIGLHRSRPPMRLVDLPMARQELPIWAEHLYPAGFRETLGTGLFTPDGRHLGVVSVNTGDPRPASEESRVLLHQLRPLIASAVDPLRDIATLAEVVTDAAAGVVCTAGGGTLALPGLPGHSVLATGSPVLTAVQAQLAGARVHAVFLCPADDAGAHTAAHPLYQVTALACTPEPLGLLWAVVLLSPPPSLHGLTRRELEVLGLLVKGWSNAHMAATLVVTERTVAAHVEHIMVKLGATSRTMAAVRALGRGLFIPPELTLDPHRDDAWGRSSDE